MRNRPLPDGGERPPEMKGQGLRSPDKTSRNKTRRSPPGAGGLGVVTIRLEGRSITTISPSRVSLDKGRYADFLGATSPQARRGLSGAGMTAWGVGTGTRLGGSSSSVFTRVACIAVRQSRNARVYRTSALLYRPARCRFESATWYPYFKQEPLLEPTSKRPAARYGERHGRKRFRQKRKR